MAEHKDIPINYYADGTASVLQKRIREECVPE